MAKAPSYKGLSPASKKASRIARGGSKKTDTKPEVMLRKALWRAGKRYRKNVKKLSGKPDIVFHGARVVVFVDGDFWHGKDWEARKAKLEKGHNAPYWVAKIERNIERDKENQRKLEEEGWVVLRYWESDVKKDTESVVREVATRLEKAV
jgi:DNA mismatch endonuclease (patch repair protein)